MPGFSPVARVQELLARLPNVKIMEHEIEFPSDVSADDIGVNIWMPTYRQQITVALPNGAVLKRAMLVALLTALNREEAAQKIGLYMEGRAAGGEWDEHLYSAGNPIIGFGAVEGATVNLAILADVSDLVTDEGVYEFRWQVLQSAANTVRYTTQFLLVITYSMG